jgi:hypothetical protein
MNENELYSIIVKPARIVGICGQTTLVTAIEKHVIADLA